MRTPRLSDEISLRQKMALARIYFDKCVFRRAHNMKIRAMFNHRLKCEIARIV